MAPKPRHIEIICVEECDCKRIKGRGDSVWLNDNQKAIAAFDKANSSQKLYWSVHLRGKHVVRLFQKSRRQS